jgi:hypothetical protein
MEDKNYHNLISHCADQDCVGSGNWNQTVGNEGLTRIQPRTSFCSRLRPATLASSPRDPLKVEVPWHALENIALMACFREHCFRELMACFREHCFREPIRVQQNFGAVG